MKLVGSIVLALTCGLLVWKFGEISFWSLGLGLALGVGCFVLASKPEVQPPVQTNESQDRFRALELETAQTVDGLNKEVQKLQQKLMRAEERCLSYQKLVDVHQSEIDKLSQEKNSIGESLIEKDRKLSEMQLARLEPDLFDTEKRQTEISYRELRKQFEEKSEVLSQVRTEKKKLETELFSLQQIVSELTLARTPKKKKPILSESRDLLG
jgi:chromosome segregation ATPase